MNIESVVLYGNVLNNVHHPIKARIRALYGLKANPTNLSVDLISKCLKDESALLKHECAYCLGQMGNKYAIQFLIGLLQDEYQEPVVRHEAGEALGAIGAYESIVFLKEYTNSNIPEVAETCTVAVCLLQHLANGHTHAINKFGVIDPAPMLDISIGVDNLRKILLDEQLPVFQRYGALFSLRELNSVAATNALCDGLRASSSALLKHEIAFVLGQIQPLAAIDQLKSSLSDISENCMVRHECAEALGSIGKADCAETLKAFLYDNEPIVRESCEIALDIFDYNNCFDFQFTDPLKYL